MEYVAIYLLQVLWEDKTRRCLEEKAQGINSLKYKCLELLALL